MMRFKKMIRVIFLLAVSALFLSGCPGSEDMGVADDRNYLTDIELSILDQVNQYRTEQGMAPLTLDINIVIQARNHSQNMAEGSVPFSHQGLKERAAATGITFDSVSENVAYHQEVSNLAATVVNGWLQSEGHHKNIIGNFNFTGVGVVPNPSGRYYFTQIFIRSAEETGPNLSWLRFWDR